MGWALWFLPAQTIPGLWYFSPQHPPPPRPAASPVAGQVLADFLLVVPEQAVQRQHVAVADEGQAVVDGVAGRAVGRDVKEKPAIQTRNNHGCGRESEGLWGHSELSLHTPQPVCRPQAVPSRCVKVALHKVIKRPHVLLFCKQHVVGNTLKDLKEKKMANTHKGLMY